MKTYRLPLLLIIFAFVFASSALANSLFVAARRSDEIAVIDPSINQVVTQIPVGGFRNARWKQKPTEATLIR
jgi:YVTN family beta-propeller protein